MQRWVGAEVVSRVAVIGTGIAGLSAAYHLKQAHEHVTLFEADTRLGGHTHTVDVQLEAAGKLVTHGVDTGFLVFNERTYPGLIQWFKDLRVETAATDMSFSAQVPGAFGEQALEWNGASLDTVFAQRSNLLRPRFWGMLRDILRFNREATRLAEEGRDHELMQPLSAFLAQQNFGDAFVHWYLLPMLGCIWSCPTDQMLAFPTATMVRFCHNHGLIQVNGRPKWWTVVGGARHYVDAVAAQIDTVHIATPVRRIQAHDQGVSVLSHLGTQDFDAVVLATHADQALALWPDAPEGVRQALSAIRFQANEAVLHTDTSVMPKRTKAWAAWNYERAQDHSQESAQVCLHYWLNRLQPLPFDQPVIVSLNPVREVSPERVIGRYAYDHPVFDAAAIAAQARLQAPVLEGRVALAGAWLGYGFHEDGFQAGRRAAEQLRAA